MATLSVDWSQACHLSPAHSLLKEPERFLEYGLLQSKLMVNQQTPVTWGLDVGPLRDPGQAPGLSRP